MSVSGESVGTPGGREVEPDVGTRWRKKPPGREVVEVHRRWMYGYPEAADTVRAHPITGGRPLVAPVSWLLENYDLEESS